MSQENVEIVRRYFAEWNEGDIAAGRDWDPDIVWEEATAFPDHVVVRGRAAVIERLRERARVIGRMLITVEALTPVGQDGVLAELEVRGSGQASGVELSRNWFQIATVRDGLITGMQEFATKDKALEARACRSKRAREDSNL